MMIDGLDVKETIKKLKVLMVLRLVLVTAALAAGSMVLRVDRIPFYSVIALFYFVTVVYAVLLKVNFPVLCLAYIQILIDVFLETIIVHYAGGANSIFVFLYAPSIVLAGVIVSSRAAKTIAGISCILYGLLSGLEYFNIIPAVQLMDSIYREGPWTIVFVVSFRIIIFCLIGYLSSYLSSHIQKEKAEYLRLSKLVDLILDNIQSGVVRVDSSGNLENINSTARDILGREGESLDGIYWPKLFWLEPEENEVSNFIFQAKTQKGVDIDVVKPDGRKAVLKCNYSPIKDDNNRQSGGVIMFSDFTILREIEAIAKPFAVEELRHIVRRALEHKRLVEKGSVEIRDSKDRDRFDDIVGRSGVIQNVYQIIERLANSDSTVLIYGESGTGKELVAKAVHHHSPRRNKPFIAINCGGLPEGLLESELFGHVKGAFTGAVSDKEGLFKVADGGTIFLDEISATSSTIQVKLLRVLQEREVKRVGDTKDIAVDVRVIAATNTKLKDEVLRGNFREDLFYRLSVIPLDLPPLRDRKEDIPILVKHFVAKYNVRDRRNLKEVEAETMELLMDYDWPGNVRELENVIERALTLSEGDEILPKDLPEKIMDNIVRIEKPKPISLKDVMKQQEREYINKVISQCRGDKKEAAMILNIDLATLYRKISDKT